VTKVKLSPIFRASECHRYNSDKVTKKLKREICHFVTKASVTILTPIFRALEGFVTLSLVTTKNKNKKIHLLIAKTKNLLFSL